MDSSLSFFREKDGDNIARQHLSRRHPGDRRISDTHLLADLSVDEDDVVQSQDDFGDALCSSVLPGNKNFSLCYRHEEINIRSAHLNQ